MDNIYIKLFHCQDEQEFPLWNGECGDKVLLHIYSTTYIIPLQFLISRPQPPVG